MAKPLRVLSLHLCREYWEQIRDKKKPYEYRKVTVYWMRRLVNTEYDEIHLLLGYPNRGETERILKRKWLRKPEIIKIRHKHFGQKPVFAFAIDVSEEI